MERTDTYVSPLETRYAGLAMRTLFGDQRKFSTWRRLWLALAQCQKELGLNITDAQIATFSAHLDDIDFETAAAYEKKLRHDVMAHIHAYGDLAPEARGIIHLGATSQYVVDNTDLILMREGMGILIGLLVNVIDALSKFARQYRDLPCLGFTHFQPAQMTTVGKRATLWCYEFLLDLAELEHRQATLEFRGVKGTTGTQASFLALFDGDHLKVKKLEQMVAAKFGFDRIAPVTGQTYSRKVDVAVAFSVGAIGSSVHKFANDVRLLAHRKEVEEPFETSQVGSSAMAYKRNPMRCERATGLSRWLMDICTGPLHTAAEQWFERTLDDSSNKRLAIPEIFLTADAVLHITLNVCARPGGLSRHHRRRRRRGTAVHGHREHSHGRRHGWRRPPGSPRANPRSLAGRRRAGQIARPPQRPPRPPEIRPRLRQAQHRRPAQPRRLHRPSALQQVDDFLAANVVPVLEKYKHLLGEGSELKV